MQKAQFILQATKWAKDQGFNQIKANAEDFESPTQYTFADKNQTFIPDVTGIRKGKKNYVEIATKEDDIRDKLRKWKLLDTLAKTKGGMLFLLAPRGHKAFAEKIVREHSLDAEVIYLNN